MSKTAQEWAKQYVGPNAGDFVIHSLACMFDAAMSQARAEELIRINKYVCKLIDGLGEGQSKTYNLLEDILTVIGSRTSIVKIATNQPDSEEAS